MKIRAIMITSVVLLALSIYEYDTEIRPKRIDKEMNSKGCKYIFTADSWALEKDVNEVLVCEKQSVTHNGVRLPDIESSKLYFVTLPDNGYRRVIGKRCYLCDGQSWRCE